MDAMYRKDGVLYGPDPYEQFVGDPRSQYALGCFAPVIEKGQTKKKITLPAQNAAK